MSWRQELVDLRPFSRSPGDGGQTLPARDRRAKAGLGALASRLSALCSWLGGQEWERAERRGATLSWAKQDLRVASLLSWEIPGEALPSRITTMSGARRRENLTAVSSFTC